MGETLLAYKGKDKGRTTIAVSITETEKQEGRDVIESNMKNTKGYYTYPS